VHTTSNELGISWITIAHDYGYLSSYLYLSDIYVSEGDLITKGTVIGRSGGEAGTSGAGLFAAGSNLTFIVTKHGRYVDPLALLDLSAVTNKNIIPDTLTFKYHRDIQKRPIDLTRLDVME
jgi:murein DD-endopeptidase MepM/ murein hydrolase activator NlpD